MNIPIDNYRTVLSNLGRELRSARESRKLTMKQVAEQLGIDEATVSKIENGKWNAGIAFYVSMAKIYGLKVTFIRNYDEDNMDDQCQ